MAVAPETTELPGSEDEPEPALVDSPPAPPPSIDGDPFGRYLLRPLRNGGMGCVFTAWDTLGGRFVALKKLGCDLPKDSKAVHRFSDEAKLVLQLDHPHVVPAYEFNEHEGQLYFTMKLMPRSLADSVSGYRNDPGAVAELVAKIAEGVHYVHQRGLIHCDLKPANILLDANDNPYVADFGIAQRVDPATNRVRRIGRKGSPSFMAPEQVDEGTDPPTQAADIHSLGVILYQLITGGALPFPGRTPSEVLQKVRNSPPVDPSSVPGEGKVDRDLAAIALRCLKKPADERYASAKELASELRRYLSGEPVGHDGRSHRIWHWCIKHRAVLSLSLSLVLFATTLALMSLSIVRSEDELQRREIQHAVEVRAGLGARSVLLHFMELARAVHDVAESPDLVQAVDEYEREYNREREREREHEHEHEHEPNLGAHAIKNICDQALRKYNDPKTLQEHDGGPFRFWSAYDAHGVSIAHTLVDNPFNGSDFSGRDYFLGAKRLGEKGLHQTHLSFVFVGTSSLEFEFALSAPIFAIDGRWLGVLVAGVLTTGQLNSAPLDDPRYCAVLVGPEDPSSGPIVPPILPPSSPNPVRFRVFRHPKLLRGTSRLFEHPLIRAMVLNQEPEERVLHWQQPPLNASDRGRALKGYEDPFEGTARSRSTDGRLAAFAPVGRTGYTVIVQFNDEDALDREKRFLWRLLSAGALAAALGTLLATLPAIFQFARMRRRASRHSRTSRARLAGGAA